MGVFATAGHSYQAWVRFSNADVVPLPDTIIGPDGKPAHGSRGMAIKLLNVPGCSLLEPFGAPTQDFLMINSPVFAFANVEDYLALSKVLQEDADQAGRFFKDRIRLTPGPTGPVPDLTDPVTARAARTAGIVAKIRSASFQPAPFSPTDNTYFSAAPFLFGEDRVMKFAAKPLAPSAALPVLTDGDHYLRKALHERLQPGMPDVAFSFEVQIRTAQELDGKIDTEIEDACVNWDSPFQSVATLVIPPQNTNSPARKALCEDLFFTPWHGIADHRPLGGINRLRKAVYEASALLRHLPKEPATW